jgi:phenylacetate-CoA ligase
MSSRTAGLDGSLPVPSGPGDLSYQRRLKDSQWWPADRLLAHQIQALSSLLAHSHRTVAFHRRRVDAIGIELGRSVDLDGWRRLPSLTRRDIQRAGADLLSSRVPVNHGRLISTKTSGSTGTPVTVRGTILDAVVGKAFGLRHYLWHPYDFTAKLAAIRREKGQTYAYPRGASFARWGDTGTFPFATGPAAVLGIGASIAEQAEWLVRQDPDYLLTYPSNLRFLAGHCRERGIALPHLEHVTTIGEVLTAETREECRRAWGVPVLDIYSAQEVGTIALQCPTGERYHVQSERILVEVVDERGAPCGPGQTGRVLVTPLYNYAMPLLRYELGDWAELGDACPCGRGLPVLSRVLGRERNGLLVAPTGARYWPAFGSRKLTELAPIVQHQFVQKSLERIEARFVTERPLTTAEERSLRIYIQAALPHRFDVSFAYCDEIPRNASGKFESFVCEVSA